MQGLPLRIPDWGQRPLVVACIDLGVNTDLAAFTEAYRSDWTPIYGSAHAYNAGGVRKHLVCHLACALDAGPVALGIEGPMWGLAESALGPYQRRSFETGGYSRYAWYDRAGAPAGLKACLLLRELINLLKPSVVTYGIHDPLVWKPRTLLLWEAFVVGEDAKTKATDPPNWTKWTRASNPAANRAINGHTSDALKAVRQGFASNPVRKSPSPLRTKPVVLPIAGIALAATDVNSLPPLDERCMVIEPGLPHGVLHWPQ